MAKFRKKPVVIEAFQMTAARMESNVDWPLWLHRACNLPIGEIGSLWNAQTIDEPTFNVATLEGVMTVFTDDWIIRGIKGELYPCKPDIFEATHEEVKGGEDGK